MTDQATGTFPVSVRRISAEGLAINSYELVDPRGGDLPPFSAGSHIDVHLGNGEVRQYSLCNDPHERHRYVIAVLHDEKGRGGSAWMHQRVHVRDIVSVSAPRNHFGLHTGAGKAVLLAGGIGVTPLKAMVHELQRAGAPYELHYCARQPDSVAFTEELKSLAESGTVQFHFDGADRGQQLDIAGLLAERDPDSHVYYCGPAGFMTACGAATAHWPAENVHCEHFKAPTSSVAKSEAATESGFVAKLKSTGQSIPVADGQSLVDALDEAGVHVDTSCRSGLCGSCKVRYLSGDVEHNDCILSDDEHREFMTACVSRGRGEIVLDL